MLKMTDVGLEFADADLNLIFGPEGTNVATASGRESQLLHGGVRANSGIKSGKYYFKVNFTRGFPTVDVEHSLAEALKTLNASNQQNTISVGVSYKSCPLPQLGLAPQSWCYSSRGKLRGLQQSRSGSFPEFGEGDEIGCFVEAKSSEVSISFSKNGEWLGEAFKVSRSANSKDLIYPHVVLQNAKADIKFGGLRVNGFQAWQNVGVAPPPSPSMGKESFEAILVSGLPACGKTQWSEEYAIRYPTKHYRIINTQLVLQMMQIDPYHNFQKASKLKSFAALCNIAGELALSMVTEAARRPGNYIIDHNSLVLLVARRSLTDKHIRPLSIDDPIYIQCSESIGVSQEGRAHCLRPFQEAGFFCKAVALVQGYAEQARRQKLAIASGACTAQAYQTVQAAFKLPQQNEGFTTVMYPKEQMTSAERILFAAEKEAVASKANGGEHPEDSSQGNGWAKRARHDGHSRKRKEGKDPKRRGQQKAPAPRLGPHLHPSDLNLVPRPPAGLKPGYMAREVPQPMQHHSLPEMRPEVLQAPLQAAEQSLLGGSAPQLTRIISGNSYRGPPGFQNLRPVHPQSQPNGHLPAHAGQAPSGFGAHLRELTGPDAAAERLQLRQDIEPASNRGGGWQHIERGQPLADPPRRPHRAEPWGREPPTAAQPSDAYEQADKPGPPGFEQPIARRTYNTLDRRTWGTPQPAAERLSGGPPRGGGPGPLEHVPPANHRDHQPSPFVLSVPPGVYQQVYAPPPRRPEEPALMNQPAQGQLQNPHGNPGSAQQAPPQGFHELPDPPQPQTTSEQRRLDAWQRGKEQRAGYMSPALPGHVSSHSTHHPFQSQAHAQANLAPNSGPDSSLTDAPAGQAPNHVSHETQQPVIQNQGRTEEVPQGVAAMSSSGQQSGQQEGTEPAKAPRTGAVSGPRLAVDPTKPVKHSISWPKPQAAPAQPDHQRRAEETRQPTLQVDAALDDTQQVAAAVYGPDVSTVHPKGPPVFGHAAQQGLHHSQHPPHHGHLEQPDMQGFGQPQPLPGPTFAPPLPPEGAYPGLPGGGYYQGPLGHDHPDTWQQHNFQQAFYGQQMEPPPPWAHGEQRWMHEAQQREAYYSSGPHLLYPHQWSS